MLEHLINTISSLLADPSSKSRQARFAKARIILTGVARSHNVAYSEIAAMIGRDRTTVYHYERSCSAKNLGKEYELYLKLRNDPNV